MKDMVNILFVCGYGVGSSAISESIVKKALAADKINAEVQHTAVGEMDSMKNWTDITIISTKLAEGIDFAPEQHVLKVINVMDGKGIAKSVGAVVDEFFPDARQR